jgi:hypothetical protein
MMTAVICGLAVAALYLGARWNGARAENETLKSQIAALKRRLSRRDH